jgi:hypothetical protein
LSISGSEQAVFRGGKRKIGKAGRRKQMTIEQLQALSSDELSNLATIPLTIQPFTEMADDELNALAAKLRGWKLENGRYWEEDGSRSTSEMRLDRWMPATDCNQSRELLKWAAKRGVRITVQFGSWSSAVNDGRFLRCLIADRYPVRAFDLAENDARAETIAFCAAMLAIQGESK